MAVWVTGDTHGDWINRLKMESFPEQKEMSKDDFVIICGDFGIWDNSKRENHNLDWLENKHQGIVIGYSAGAVIQLAEYHLSPDEDYPEFRYYKGLSYLDDFYLQVHYEASREQDESIRRILNERGRTVYATAYRSGAIMADNGSIRLLGNVKKFASH